SASGTIHELATLGRVFVSAWDGLAIGQEEPLKAPAGGMGPLRANLARTASYRGDPGHPPGWVPGNRVRGRFLVAAGLRPPSQLASICKFGARQHRKLTGPPVTSIRRTPPRAM